MNGIKVTYDNYNRIEETDLAKLSSYSDGIEYNYLGSIILNINPLIFSEIVKDSKSSEIEFGEYPQTEVSEELSKKLESIHNTQTVSSPEKIEPINERYTTYSYVIKKVPVLTNISYSHEILNNSFRSCKVFLYNGEKYLRYKNKKNGNIRWIKIEPLRWKVDREKNELRSVKAFVNGALENYLYDASTWDYGLAYITSVRMSNDKTHKYLNDVMLANILQTVSIKKIVKYQSFEDLKRIIKDNRFFDCFHDFGTIEFEGPALSTRQKESISSMLGRKITKSFKEEKKEEEKFSKFKLIEAKEKAEDKKEIDRRYKDVLSKINDLKNAIAALEMEKGNSSRILNRLYSSIVVPDEVLIVTVGDHREFNPEFVPLLKYIDLSQVDIKNLKLSHHDLSETNIHFDPQEIYQKDLSYSKLSDENVSWKSFDGVNLTGANIEMEKDSYDLDKAIIDENTKLPVSNSKTL